MSISREHLSQKEFMTYDNEFANKINLLFKDFYKNNKFLEKYSDLEFIRYYLALMKQVINQFKGREREAYFYTCMEISKIRTFLFPTVDICILIFNYLSHRIEKTNQIICFDISLLPITILFSEYELKISLTDDSDDTEIYDLTTLLNNILPNTTWETREEDSKIPENSFVLGQHPGVFLEKNPNLLEELKNISSGIFFTYWEFLGSRSSSFWRDKLLKSGLITHIVQLSRPKRQNAFYYPALIILNKKASLEADLADKIRLVFYDAGATPKSRDLLFAVTDLQDADKVISCNPSELYVKGVADFTPRFHIIKNKRSVSQAQPLGSLAVLLRCQLSRTREQSLEFTNVNILDEQAKKIIDDGTLYREILLSSFEPLSGIILERGNIVKVPQLSATNKQSKYILTKNDIVISFRGSEGGVGKVGLCTLPGLPAITGQSLCIIRTFQIDPIYLYYYLRKKTIQEEILSNCVGKAMLTINLSDLRELAITIPSQFEIEKINATHKKTMETMQTFNQACMDLEKYVWETEQYYNE